MILNVVVDAVIRHWVVVVAPTKDSMEVLGLSIQELTAYLYADNGLIVSTRPERLQREFDVLTGIFDWVGLRTNTRKIVSMVCHQ